MSGKIVALGEEGSRIIEFSFSGVFEEVLETIGTMPLPPYITEKLEDQERYQTVYSEHKGSAAAPTAGLHFTKDLLRKIEEKGVKVAYVTLHAATTSTDLTSLLHLEVKEFTDNSFTPITPSVNDGTFRIDATSPTVTAVTPAPTVLADAQVGVGTIPEKFPNAIIPCSEATHQWTLPRCKNPRVSEQSSLL